MQRIREDGTAAVEFAIILPLLIVIVFGIIEFGFMLYMKGVITNASREGARAGIIQAIPKPSATDVQNVVKTYLQSAGLKLSKCVSSNCADVTGVGGVFGTNLTVKLDYRYDFLVLPKFIGGGPNMTLSATTVMKHE